MFKFNMNQTVKVKLTEYGLEIHKKDWESFWLHGGPARAKIAAYNPPKEDEDGYSTWQLWSLMQLYGEHIGLGFNNLPFETDIILIVEQPVFENGFNFSTTKSQKWGFVENNVKTKSILFENVLLLRAD